MELDLDMKLSGYEDASPIVMNYISILSLNTKLLNAGWLS